MSSPTSSSYFSRRCGGWRTRTATPPTQARLAAQAGTDPMMTSRVIRKLEARGLLERRLDPSDARAPQLQLTARGRAVAASALADVEAADNDYFAAIEARRNAFIDALGTLAAAERT